MTGSQAFVSGIGSARVTGVARALWRLTGWALVGAALAGLIAVAALLSVPRILGWQGVVVLSGSMEPVLPVGSVVFVDKSGPEGITVGDVMTHRKAIGTRTTLVTHRVVEIVPGPDGPQFVTKGDANEAIDTEPVPASAVVGRARVQVPLVGHVIDGLRDRSTFYLLIGIPAALLILSELWNIASDLRRPRPGKDGAAGSEGSPS
jgi:signal peptidase